jgi:hypothetical protein
MILARSPFPHSANRALRGLGEGGEILTGSSHSDRRNPQIYTNKVFSDFGPQRGTLSFEEFGKRVKIAPSSAVRHATLIPSQDSLAAYQTFRHALAGSYAHSE